MFADVQSENFIVRIKVDWVTIRSLTYDPTHLVETRFRLLFVTVVVWLCQLQADAGVADPDAQYPKFRWLNSLFVADAGSNRDWIGADNIAADNEGVEPPRGRCDARNGGVGGLRLYAVAVAAPKSAADAGGDDEGDGEVEAPAADLADDDSADSEVSSDCHADPKWLGAAVVVAAD